MQLFVISLEDAFDRRARLEPLLRKLGLPHVFVPGVVGRNLSDDELDRFKHRSSLGLSPGEIGCLLSHVRCWELLLASDMPFAFVCEDDVHFSPSARAVLGELRMPVDEPAVTKLETYLVPALLSRTPFQKIGKHSVCELKSFHAGTGIYAINRAAAERLRAVWTEMILPIDKEMFEPGRASARGVTVFQVCPAPCIQLAMWPGRTAADESAAKSAIGAERMDAGANEGRRSRRFGPVGLAARLVYWSVQSLFLRSRGLKRAYLRFA